MSVNYEVMQQKLFVHQINLIPGHLLNKTTLTSTFSDTRNIDCLVNDLITTSPNRNETLSQFGLKLQNIRSLIISKLNKTNDSPNTKNVKTQHFEQLTLKTYLNNLPEKNQITVKCKNPNTIEEAINYVKTKEGDIEFKLRTQNKFPHKNRPTIKPTFNPNRISRTQIPSQNYFYANPFAFSHRPPMTKSICISTFFKLSEQPIK